ncbi:hypothetical protein PO591_21260 [Escherichia coli]|uniref:hypothetical protein n=1 Tax=Escherichia coli TaxID=562 RepID=UPI00259CD934|nr:hypothetical protein [Escherichia coli]MDM4819788.1 hypothetical protein [Escherichia coli]MDM4847577.1 hypothetical protein [Escherichia coli]HBB3243504.1 hypothetical protein [Escherichia coli]HBB3256194.1 hypothetical protein [Escherichia coli]HBB3358071.1 hypothetical protein [Escherichia coli]
MAKIRITHRYDINKDMFYGVETNQPYEKVVQRLAYLQLIHSTLPDFPYMANCLEQADAVELYCRIFGGIPLNTNQHYTAEIDLYRNWELDTRELVNDINCQNSIAISGCVEKIFKYIVENSVQIYQLTKEAYKLGQGMTINEKEEMALLLIYMDWQLQRMDRVLMGEKIQKEWDWHDFEGRLISDISYTHTGQPDLYIHKD